MTPAFKKRYQNNINNNYDILYNSISFQQFSALGREGMVKYISKSLIALAKNGVIKTIKTLFIEIKPYILKFLK